MSIVELSPFRFVQIRPLVVNILWREFIKIQEILDNEMIVSDRIGSGKGPPSTLDQIPDNSGYIEVQQYGLLITIHERTTSRVFDVVDTEVNARATITIHDPTVDRTFFCSRQTKHIIDLIEEYVPACAQHVIGMVLLKAEEI